MTQSAIVRTTYYIAVLVCVVLFQYRVDRNSALSRHYLCPKSFIFCLWVGTHLRYKLSVGGGPHCRAIHELCSLCSTCPLLTVPAALTCLLDVRNTWIRVESSLQVFAPSGLPRSLFVDFMVLSEVRSEERVQPSRRSVNRLASPPTKTRAIPSTKYLYGLQC